MPKESIPSTGDPLVDAALERIRGKFTDLEDAMLVQLHLGKRAGERIKEHAQLIADHRRRRSAANDRKDLRKFGRCLRLTEQLYAKCRRTKRVAAPPAGRCHGVSISWVSLKTLRYGLSQLQRETCDLRGMLEE